MTITMDETITVADLTALSEANPLLRYELSPEGTIEATMTPRSRHNGIIAELMFWLHGHLPDATRRIYQDTGVMTRTEGGTGYRQPDLMLFTQEPPDDQYLDPALVILVVEVVSPSTRRIDFEEKIREYATSGIPHYWIVDADENVRMHRLDEHTGVYHQYDAHTLPLTELLTRDAKQLLV
jgi:Uma2 family endonuclease